MRESYVTPRNKIIFPFGQKEKNCLPPQIIHLYVICLSHISGT